MKKPDANDSDPEIVIIPDQQDMPSRWVFESSQEAEAHLYSVMASARDAGVAPERMIQIVQETFPDFQVSEPFLIQQALKSGKIQT